MKANTPTHMGLCIWLNTCMDCLWKLRSHGGKAFAFPRATFAAISVQCSQGAHTACLSLGPFALRLTEVPQLAVRASPSCGSSFSLLMKFLSISPGMTPLGPAGHIFSLS